MDPRNRWPRKDQRRSFNRRDESLSDFSDGENEPPRLAVQMATDRETQLACRKLWQIWKTDKRERRRKRKHHQQPQYSNTQQQQYYAPPPQSRSNNVPMGDWRPLRQSLESLVAVDAGAGADVIQHQQQPQYLVTADGGWNIGPPQTTGWTTIPSPQQQTYASPPPPQSNGPAAIAAPVFDTGWSSGAGSPVADPKRHSFSQQQQQQQETTPTATRTNQQSSALVHALQSIHQRKQSLANSAYFRQLESMLINSICPLEEGPPEIDGQPAPLRHLVDGRGAYRDILLVNCGPLVVDSPLHNSRVDRWRCCHHLNQWRLALAMCVREVLRLQGRLIIHRPPSMPQFTPIELDLLNYLGATAFVLNDQKSLGLSEFKAQQKTVCWMDQGCSAGDLSDLLSANWDLWSLSSLCCILPSFRMFDSSAPLVRRLMRRWTRCWSLPLPSVQPVNGGDGAGKLSGLEGLLLNGNVYRELFTTLFPSETATVDGRQYPLQLLTFPLCLLFQADDRFWRLPDRNSQRNYDDDDGDDDDYLPGSLCDPNKTLPVDVAVFSTMQTEEWQRNISDFSGDIGGDETRWDSRETGADWR